MRSKIRVLVVDDAVVMRRLITGVLESDPEMELAGVAANGALALAKIPQVNPDVITLDVEMPEMDGLQTIVEIRKLYPRLPIIMFSTLTKRGAVQTVEALARGATDYVAKPANIGSVSEAIVRLQEELLPKIRAYTRPALPESPSQRFVTAPLPKDASRCRILAIGSSTGGPNALHQVIPELPADLPVPVVIVQHMPAVFTELLAQRLDEVSKVCVSEAKDGQLIEAGKVYIAPGGRHLVVANDNGRVRCRLNEDPPENSCRPAVDVLFRSVVNLYGSGTLGLVLTGMGQDGMRGARWIREAGGEVIAQDKASSVVWGMPGAVAEAGLANQVVALENVSKTLLQRVHAREPQLCR